MDIESIVKLVHEPRLYAPEGPVTEQEGKYTCAFVGCTCGWNSDGKAYLKEGDWHAHVVATLESYATSQREMRKGLEDELDALHGCLLASATKTGDKDEMLQRIATLSAILERKV